MDLECNYKVEQKFGDQLEKFESMDSNLEIFMVFEHAHAFLHT